MKFWLGNQVSAEYDAGIDDLASRYWASKRGRQMLDPSIAFPLERSLRSWLASKDGLNSSWQDESEETGFGALFEKVRETWPKIRCAKVARGEKGTAFGIVAAYLPANYWIARETGEAVYIIGTDNAGWTLDGYVIPRLASGLIFCEEITEQEAS
jgi:hypothetical protein